MKSETQIKIKQSRQKYFQEIRSGKTEKNTETTNRDEIQNQQEPGAEQQPEPELDLGRVLKDLIENMPAITLPVIISRERLRKFHMVIGQGLGRLSKGVAKIGHGVTEVLDRRTEKIRSRLYSYMLILFDA